MQLHITRQQIGLLVTVIGTILLAFSVRTRSQYGREMADIIQKAENKNQSLIVPTETCIVIPLFRGGLMLVVFGSLLQW
ncbi:MAG: hypothetical protein ACFFDT_09135 [Candidatus Hodarchaeota archaeon]